MTFRAKRSSEGLLLAAERIPDTGFSPHAGEDVPHLDVAEFRRLLELRIGNGAMAVWFGDGIQFSESVAERTLFIIVPTSFFRERISTRFRKDLDRTIEETANREWRVEVILADEAIAKGISTKQSRHKEVPSGPDISAAELRSIETSSAESKATYDSENPTLFGIGYDSVVTSESKWPVAQPTARRSQIPGLFAPGQLKATRRLDNFVVGSCNRLALTAAVEMVKSRGASFNPLILHGGVGLGKTHLLDGVAHALRNHPIGGRLVHVTAEAFTNAFLESMRTGQLASFRNRFRHSAALIVDDIQFIASKRATQSEFLHTFNALIEEEIPIVISSDQHPKLVNRLMEELSTRFMAGMVVRLDTPDPEVRRLILRNKAAARGINLPDNVVDLVSEQLRSSVRELEGALNSLIAHSVLSGRKIDLDLARNVLRDSIRHKTQFVTLQEIDAATCEALSISSEDLHSLKLNASISTPRMLAMYLARRHTSASYSEIAQHFGLKNHSSVIAAEKRVKQWLDGKPRSRKSGDFDDVLGMLEAIRTSLGV